MFHTTFRYCRRKRISSHQNHSHFRPSPHLPTNVQLINPHMTLTKQPQTSTPLLRRRGRPAQWDAHAIDSRRSLGGPSPPPGPAPDHAVPSAPRPVAVGRAIPQLLRALDLAERLLLPLSGPFPGGRGFGVVLVRVPSDGEGGGRGGRCGVR